MKKLMLFFCALFFLEAVAPDKAAKEQAEVREYATKFNDLLQKHIDALSAAADAKQTASAMQSYAKDMKPTIKKSKAIKKKYPNMGGDNIELRSLMQSLNTKVTKVNELLEDARRKYGTNKSFKKAEKALIAAGLFGRK